MKTDCLACHDRSDGCFTQVNNEVIRDRRLTAAEKCMFISMWSLPENWNFSIKGLMAVFGGSPGSWCKAIKKLESLGYMRKIPKRNALADRVQSRNLTVSYDYILCDKPSKYEKSLAITDFVITSHVITRNDTNKYRKKKEKKRNTKSTTTTKQGSGESAALDESEVVRPEDLPEYCGEELNVGLTEEILENYPREGSEGVTNPGERPTTDEFLSWARNFACNHNVREEAIESCVVSYEKAISRGWESADGESIRRWREYFGSVMLKANSRILRTIEGVES